MKEIRSETKSLNALLSNAKFDVDYYQREYVWEESHVEELVNDLSDAFLKSYEPEHAHPQVAFYELYFLGTIIISDVSGRPLKLVVDGQQRLTSLTLLLIVLHHHVKTKRIDTTPFENLISSQKFGQVSYNLDVADRITVLDALFRNVPFDRSNASGSNANIIDRYEDIENDLPDDITDPSVLPMFVDWLLHRVFFVEITAYSDADAYTMFESMNNRGLSLTTVELLRGYLLSQIDTIGARQQASVTWKARSDSVSALGRDSMTFAIRHWLRSQHADSMAEFDAIGSDFNRWMREPERKEQIGLDRPVAYANLINTDFAFYTKWYQTVRTAESKPEYAAANGLQSVRYNAINNFTLQHPAILAALSPKDDDVEIFKKIRLLSTYIDCMLVRRVWDYNAIYESHMRSRIFTDLIVSVRGTSTDELADLLAQKLVDYKAQFNNRNFALHQQNRRRVLYILARLADFIGTRCGQPPRFEDYMNRGGQDPFEIEHIWSNTMDIKALGFTHEVDFDQYRNRIGGLLLLPKSFNSSFGSKPYAEKYKQYFGQNMWAKSLHENAYANHPNFRKFENETGLPFKSHAQFGVEDLDARQELCRLLASRIWSVDAILKAGGVENWTRKPQDQSS